MPEIAAFSETEVDQLMDELQAVAGAPCRRLRSELQDNGQFLLINAEFPDATSIFIVRRMLERIREVVKGRIPRDSTRVSWVAVATIGKDVVDSVADQ